MTEDEYPSYRRPNNGRFIERDRYIFNEKGKRVKADTPYKFDNRLVAIYNPYLLKKYKCHINVQSVGSIRSVKYLFKYIYKGHDSAVIKMVNDQQQIIYDEVERQIEGRYVSC